MRWIGTALVVLALVPAGVCEGKAKLKPGQRYNRIFNKVGQRYYGLSERPPVVFGKTPRPNTQAVTTFPWTTFATPEPTIHFSRGATRDLRSRDPQTRRQSRRVVLWELGRVSGLNQDPEDNPALKRKTAFVSRQLNKQQARRKKRSLKRVAR